MAVEDLWHRKLKKCESDPPACAHKGLIPSARHGRGLQWRVRWHGQAESFRTKAEATQHWLDVRTSKTVKSDGTLVSDLVERWLLTKADLSLKGKEACAGAAAHVVTTLGHRKADSLAQTEVREWLAGLKGSASLRIKILQCLSGALEIGVDTGKVKTNVSHGVKRPKDHRHEAHFLSGAELASLAVECGGYRPMTLLMGTTGVRIGEAAAFSVGDVDAVRARARVSGRTAKTRVGRDVPVPASVLALLDLDRAADAPLFLSPDGHRVNVRNWRSRVFTPAARAAKLLPLRPHDLRHTAASLAIASGADVKKVQAMLGHKSAAMTLDLYGHLWETGIDDVAARMDALVTVDPKPVESKIDSGTPSGTLRSDEGA